MKKILVGSIIFFIGLGLYGLIFIHGPLHAQGVSDSSEVIAKLNVIAKGQEELMSAINSVKQDLQIIKVRVTQLQ